MRLDITARHFDITPSLRQLINRRLAKLERLLNDSAISGQVILTKEKYRYRTEIVVHARGDHTLRGLGEGTGWPLSVRAAADKIQQQAQTLKGKWAERKRRGGVTRTVSSTDGNESAPVTPQKRVIRNTRYPVKPMSVEDATLRVESGSETFFVFRNAETDAISILYRRTDGNYGLIEPD